MTVSPISSLLPQAADATYSAAGPYGTELAANSATDSISGLLQPPQLAAPTPVATYPKSVIPQPLPPAFREPRLPPPDPMAQEDTVSISDAARRAAQASAEANGTGGATGSALAATALA